MKKEEQLKLFAIVEAYTDGQTGNDAANVLFSEAAGIDGQFTPQEQLVMSSNETLNRMGPSGALNKVALLIEDALPIIQRQAKTDDEKEVVNAWISAGATTDNINLMVSFIWRILRRLTKKAEGGQIESLENHLKVTINDKEYDLLVAKTEEEKEKGLMDVESMEDNEGMYFCYKDDPQTELSFWMKNTTIPLDIIFISEQEEVIQVLKGEPDSEELLTCTSSKHPIIGVIEVNQNSGIKKGMDVDFDDFNEDEHPELEPNKMYVIGEDGTPQAELQGEERIFSRISTRKILKAAKKAYLSKLDKDYKKLGKIVFNELDAQESRDPQYVEARKKD